MEMLALVVLTTGIWHPVHKCRGYACGPDLQEANLYPKHLCLAPLVFNKESLSGRCAANCQSQLGRLTCIPGEGRGHGDSTAPEKKKTRKKTYNLISIRFMQVDRLEMLFLLKRRVMEEICYQSGALQSPSA